MTDRKLEQRLAEAISRAAPNDVQGVLSRCEMRKGNVIEMTTKKRRPLYRNLVAACLALALIGGSGMLYRQNLAVASVVSLDVNPSIELTVNRSEKVLACSPVNDEARSVLASMNNGADLRGAKLNVAVNAITGALVRSGYLNSISSAILISVEDKDQSRAAKLQQELTAEVDSVLLERGAEAAVLSQTLTKDTQLEKQARENSISTGKAALIAQAMELNAALSFDALAGLSVEELNDLVETGAPGMPIGREEAARRAIAYAGAEDRVSGWETDAELDDRPAHYEVELYTATGEHEYEVDAYTGEILSGRANIFAAGKEQTPAAPTSGALIGADQALAIAATDFFGRHPDAARQGEVRRGDLELDEDDGALHYEVEFFVGSYEVNYEIDARTGAVLEWDTDYEPWDDDDHWDDDRDDDDGDDDWDDDDDDDRESIPAAPTGTTGARDIGSGAAKAAAFAHAGVSEGQVYELEVERDEDDGRWEYEVEFKVGRTEYEYTIDAFTGAVLEHEIDRDDD